MIPSKHGATGSSEYGCPCQLCRAASAEQSRKTYARRQAASSDKAIRHRAEWTGPELELAARKDLTDRQVADMLGRTLAAVKGKRQRLREGEPRDQWLAGRRSRLH